ncbi:ROK family protein [Romboutsia sp.]|uniref:ROK family protein n=1 Tax=Romboutsia sp. TaxID=1965302 RepID=UPI003F3B290B
MNYLGLDIGGTALKIAILDEAGNIIASSNYPVNFDNYNTPILNTAIEKSEIFLLENKIDKLEGIAISATGQIDVKKGMVVGTGGNIKNYQGSKFKEEFEKKYNVRTTVINDANSAVLGEVFLGNAKNYKNVVMVTIGTGVGGGIVTNSKVLNGTLGIGGEVGHFSINNKGIKCSCGNRGCYERYASMTALIKRVKEELNIENINGKEIFEQININESMKNIVDEWIEDVAHGIISLVHIFNPEIVIIGGAVSEQKELFVNKVEALVKENGMENFVKNLEIEAAKLKNDAGLVGALYYHIKGEK